MRIHVLNKMRAWFNLALIFFGIAALLVITSIVLGTGLQYLSYKGLFNALTVAIAACVLLSVAFSIAGVFREKIRRYRYYLLIAGNLIFFIWIILE